MTSPDVYTHGHHEAVLRSHRWRTAANSAGYLLPHLRAGLDLLDVGSGPGTLTVDLAAHVAPGWVLGVDTATDVVAAATEHARAVGATNIEFLAGDFRTMGLQPGSFDVVHAHQVLQHLREPVAALRSMAALARPGGSIVAARDGDYAAMTWAPADSRLDRWAELYRAVAKRNGGEPDAGRHLLGWAREAGLDDVAYTTSTWTFATPAERAWWSELWAERTVATAVADQAVDHGLASRPELEDIATGWRAWARHPDAVFVVVHGEIVVHV